MVARRAHNPKATGSSPVPATTKYSRLPGFVLVGGFLLKDFQKNHGGRAGTVPSLPNTLKKEDRNAVLRQLKERKEISQRQISRVTGISENVIFKL